MNQAQSNPKNETQKVYYVKLKQLGFTANSDIKSYSILSHETQALLKKPESWLNMLVVVFSANLLNILK